MSFRFRDDQEPITLKNKDLCLELRGGTMVANNKRGGFHSTTYNCFNMAAGQDLCHRYSFSSMKKFLCYCYNSGRYEFLKDLISVMYSCAGNPYPNDYNTALEIIYRIHNAAYVADRVVCFNELLYVLNNVIINLRPGNASWNRSIRECYDPEAWYMNGQGFVIYSNNDVHLIRYLLDIPINPSTIYFYTAQDDEGVQVLYSSNNPFPNKGAKVYDECKMPIFIRLPDGTENEITLH